MINLSDDFKKYIDYISFLHDLSNDAGVSDQYNYIEMLKNGAKELIAKEVIYSNQIAKAEVAVIGDFSSGKSSFINSIICFKIFSSYEQFLSIIFAVSKRDFE